jgi:sporulation protein YlmC with PRC-barrel domain
MRSDTANQHLSLMAFLALVTSTAICSEQQGNTPGQQRAPAGQQPAGVPAGQRLTWDCANADQLVGCELHSRATVTDGDDQAVLGTVGDLVIDLKRGTVLGLRIDSGGLAGIGATQRYLAMDQVALRVVRDADDAEKTDLELTTVLSKAEFEARPVFDADHLETLRRPVDAGTGERGRAGEAGGTDGRGQNDRPADRNPAGTEEAGAQHTGTMAPPVLLSDLDSIDVRTSDADGETFGQIENLAIDPNSGRVHYALLSVGGVAGLGASVHPVPLRALTTSVDTSGSDPKLRIALRQSKAQLETAPKIDEDNGMTLDNASFREQVDRFYGVTATSGAKSN